MNNNIFIPKKIHVGFQNRDGTYTKKLAYVIYYDEKGKLRKEKSWNKWRNKDIEPITYDNIPSSGFVLNKKAGGYNYGWNHRQTYVRVFDPRGFEFEIDVPNLLYILENTNSIKGKGLEGEFIYGWDGKELVLIPTSSPDYIEMAKFNNMLHANKKIKAKDLKIGGTYLTKDNREWIYMGKFDMYKVEYSNYCYKTRTHDKETINEGKHFYFYNTHNKRFNPLKTISKKFIDIISENCVENYAEIFEKLERNKHYSPLDESKDEYINYTFEEFKERIEKANYWIYFYSSENVKNECMECSMFKSNKEQQIFNCSFRCGIYDDFKGTLEEIFNHFKPLYKNQYLVNGKLYKSRKEIY